MDSDPLFYSKCAPDDLTSILFEVFGGIQYKLIGFIFIVFMLINSDVFINRVLHKFKGAVDFKCPTSYGTFLQGIFLCIICIFIDAAIKQGVV